MEQGTVINLIKRYLLLLDTEGIPVSKAFLYGSYAEHTANDDSDIDLLIVADNFDNADDMLIGKIWYLTKKINTKIEPYLISTNRFYQDDTSPLIQLVKQYGIEIQ
jgi:predicted nucleotidyltransferase